MQLQINLESCTIIVEIFHRPKQPEWSYAVFISKLTGQTFRMTIPELCDALELAASRMRLENKP